MSLVIRRDMSQGFDVNQALLQLGCAFKWEEVVNRRTWSQHIW